MKINHDCEGTYAKYIMQELKLPASHATPEAIANYEHGGSKKRIHWMDGNNTPGAWQLNTSWFLAPNRDFLLGENAPTNARDKWQVHVHDVDEMLLFCGTDPEHPWDLGGEIEIVIGDETYILTKSSLIFLPAGLKHSTPLINRVDKPIFHFSTVLNKEYNYETADGRRFDAV